MQQDASPQASSSHMMKTTKRGRPFLKACFPPFLHSLSYRIPSHLSPGHPRPLCDSRRFVTTHNPQAILSILPKFFHHVRLPRFPHYPYLPPKHSPLPPFSLPL